MNLSPIYIILLTGFVSTCDKQTCPATAPCLSDGGFCGSTNAYCGIGCQTCGSIPNSCYIKLPCSSGNYTFQDMTNVSDYKNNTKYSGFIWERGTKQVFSNGTISIGVEYSPDSTPEFQFGYGSRLSSAFFFEYGSVEVLLKPAKGPGIVTSFIVMDNGDEIDFEFVGKDVSKVWTNYFFRGELDYTKGQAYDAGVDLSKEFHVYKIIRSEEIIEWYFDGVLIRTLLKNTTSTESVYKSNSTKGFKYPSQPGRVQFGIWDVVATKAEGTIGWGGKSDWSSEAQANGYHAFIGYVNVECQKVNPSFVSSSNKMKFDKVLLFILLVFVLF